MSTVRGWNQSQRVVASVGLGLFLVVIAKAVGAWVIGHDPDGWFNYAPNNGVIFSEIGLNWWEVLTWLAAVGVWTVASLTLFRSNTPQVDSSDAVPPTTGE